MPRKDRSRHPSEILAGLQAKARAVQPLAEPTKENMTNTETTLISEQALTTTPVRVTYGGFFGTGIGCPSTVVIIRDNRLPDGSIQVQALNHVGEWEDRVEGFEFTAAERHLLK